jgi:hypothetical protein
MEWQVRYEPQTRNEPWSVYKSDNGKRIFEQGFLTEDEALIWAEKKRKRHGEPPKKKNKVDEASKESFPASDPPAFTGTTVYKGDKNGTRKQGKIH